MVLRGPYPKRRDRPVSSQTLLHAIGTHDQRGVP
jgi:hypothetical protein